MIYAGVMMAGMVVGWMLYRRGLSDGVRLAQRLREDPKDDVWRTIPSEPVIDQERTE